MYLKRSFLTFIGYAIPIALFVPTYYLVAHNLVAEAVLAFALINTVWAFAGLFDGGIGRGSIFIFQSAEDDEGQLSALFGSVIAILIFATIVSCIFGSLIYSIGEWGLNINLVKYFPIDKGPIGIIVLITHLLNSSVIPTYSYFESRGEFGRSVGARLLFNAGPHIVTIICVINGQELLGIISSIAYIKMLSLAIIAIFFCKIRLRHFRNGLKLIVDVYVISLPLFLSTIPGITFAFCERIGAGFIPNLKVQSLTSYIFITDLLSKASIAPTIVNRSIFPEVARHGLHHARDALRFGIYSMASFSMVVLLLALIIIPLSLSVMLNAQISEVDVQIAVLLVLSWSVNVVNQVLFTAVQAAGSSATLARFQFLELLVVLPIYVWAGHQFGLIGMAACSCVRNSLDSVLLVGLTAREMRQAREYDMADLSRSRN